MKRLISLFMIALLLLTGPVLALEEEPVRPVQYDEFARRTAAGILAALDNINDCYSPLSLYFALRMAHQGADGETREEIARLLNLDGVSLKVASEEFAYLWRLVQADDALKMANAVFHGPLVDLGTAYQTGLRRSFDAEIFTVDLQTPDGLAALNQFVIDQTDGFLDPQLELDPDTILALVNVLVFSDAWQWPFEKQATYDRTFTTETGEVSTPFLHSERFVDTYVGENFSAARLTFEGGAAISFYLPTEGLDPVAILTEEEYSHLNQEQDWYYQEAELAIPKFDFSQRYALKEILQTLGLEIAFSEQAEFPGLTDSQTDLHIEEIQQVTRMALDEARVEAAAVTVIEVGETSAMPEEEIFRFRLILNRPFLFQLESRDGSVVFIGVVGDPSVG